MRDILSRADIVELVDRFYAELLDDEVVGIFFSEVVRLDMQVHLPLICDFWAGILLGETEYEGNAMLKHIRLHKKKPIEEVHFERWLALWEKNVYALYEGKTADEAVQRAKQIGGLMKYKIE